MTLTAGSTYPDLVAIQFLKDGQNGFHAPTDPVAVSWPSDPPLTLPTNEYPFTLPIARAVEVDGFDLDGGTGPRSATLTNPTTLTITWP